MTGQVVRPTMTELETGDPSLLKMVAYIKFLLQRRSERDTAHNAALAYLALMTAFEQEGLTEMGYVPDLAIEIGGVEYKVRD